jgi:hypothetical protein
LDIVFNIKKNSMLIPFPGLVEEMKKCLLSVYPKIVVEGMKNVNISQEYMSDLSMEPPHILKWLERDMGLDVATPESLELLQRKLIEERDEQIDRIQWDQSTVQGRFHDMEVHDDGTMSPLETDEMTRNMEGNGTFPRKSLREIMSFRELRQMFPTLPVRSLRIYPRSSFSDPEEDTPEENIASNPVARPYEKPPSSQPHDTDPQTTVLASPLPDPDPEKDTPEENIPSKPVAQPYETFYPSQPRTPDPQTSSVVASPLPDPEPTDWETYYFGAPQRLPPRHRESFDSHQLSRLRKIQEINEAIKSSPFKSSTRPESIIPHENTFVEDEAYPTEDTLSTLENDGDRSYTSRLRERSAEGGSVDGSTRARKGEEPTDETFDYLFGDVKPTSKPLKTEDRDSDTPLTSTLWKGDNSQKDRFPEKQSWGRKMWPTLSDGSPVTHTAEQVDGDEELEELVREMERDRERRGG